MNDYWTFKDSIHGLKHFVVVNSYKEGKEYFFELVSILDDEISLKITKKEFEKSNKWEPGFIDYQKDNIVFNEYIEFKSRKRKYEIRRITLKDNSPFNIS